MTQPLRVLLASSAFALATVALSVNVFPGGQAAAQAAKNPPKQEAPKQADPKQAAPQQDEGPKPIALTQKQIDSLVAAQPEMAKIQPGDNDKPDPKVQAKVEEIAKKNGFTNAEELEDVGDNVEAVLSGVDPESKKYVGVQPLIKKQIAAVEADKSMKPKEKAAALKELKEALKGGEPPKPSDGNIDLVTKNLDKLTQSMGNAQQ